MQDPRRFSDGHLLSPLKSEELTSDISRRLSRGLSRASSRRNSMSSVKSANSTSNSPSLDLGHLDEGEYDANLEASPSSDEKENEGKDAKDKKVTKLKKSVTFQ